MAEMNVLIIPDKFKGSLTSKQVVDSIETGIRRYNDQAQIHSVAASDGGDGFLSAILQSQPDVELVPCRTTDPLGRPIDAAIGMDRQINAAYVEMAKASGMERLTADELNPERTSTLGTGELIVEAIRQGARKVYIGLGGSATNDGGTGIASAMGYRFLGKDGETLTMSGESLQRIVSIDSTLRLPACRDVSFHAINDVLNPLLGREGAAAVYAPQKGADQEMVKRLERGLDQLQQTVRRDLGIDAKDIPGAGAAGGCGYGLRVFLDAEFLSGIEFVLSLTGVDRLLSQGRIDCIITGEGKLDDQTAYGKLVSGVATVGKKYGVPVLAICGMLDLKRQTISDLNLTAARQIHDPEKNLDFTFEHAAQLVSQAAEDLLTEINAGRTEA